MMFGLSLLSQSLIMGTLIAIACGLVGTYIVVKRLSFLSGSVAHSAFGGVGAAFLWGFSPFLGAMIAGVISAFIISFVHFRYKQDQDTLIGVIWAFGMAFGLFCLHFVHDYVPNVSHYIFGSVLLSTPTDLFLIASLDVLIILLLVFLGRGFQAISFDSKAVEVLNLPVKGLYLTLMILISITTIMVMKLVGIMLVMALLVLPAATALNLSLSFFTLQIYAVITALVSTLGGILVCFYYDLPAGPCIIVVSIALFLLSLLFRKK